MPIRGHNPVITNQFNGLFVRGRFDAVPNDHFADTLNTQPSQNGWDTRDGFIQTITTASVRRKYVYKIFGQADRLLFLDNSNNIWDSTNTTTPILTITGMTDFAFLNMFGRAYISPSNGTTGLAGQSLYVYTGSGTAVLAAGNAPSGSALVAANSATAGNVTAGTHVYAVVYETNTGFLTPLGPATFAVLNSSGNHAVDLSNITIGPSNIVARRIVATKLIPSYDGNQTGAEFFFVPGGRIGDNVTNSFTVNFFDESLLNDASYLLNLFGQIPAGVSLTSYHGRLVSSGEAANPSVVRISYAGQPEAVDQVTGLQIVDPANTSSGVVNAQEIRDSLYFFKKTRTYSTFDNQSTPSTWNTIVVDEGLGADINTVVKILDTGGISANMCFVANQQGLYIFNGAYILPEVSWKIRDLWKTINALAFNTVDVAQDPIAQRVYITIPTGSATTPNFLLMMDYANASLNAMMSFAQQTRWTKWNLGNNITPTTVAVETNPTDNTQILRVGSILGNIYTQVVGQTNDFGFAIPTPFIETGYLGEMDGMYMHCVGMVLRITGSGVLTSTLFGYDLATSSSFPNLTLAMAGGFKPFVLNNFTSQVFSLKLQVNNVDEFFKLNEIDLYVKPIRSMNPA